MANKRRWGSVLGPVGPGSCSC